MKSYQVKNEKGDVFEVDVDKIDQAERDGYFPVVSNGKEELRVSFSDLTKAKKDGFWPSKKIETTDTLITKAAQGVSAGFSDELAGGVEALGSLVGIKDAGGPISDIEMGDDASFKDAYKRGRDRERFNQKESDRQNPVLSKTAEIASSVISPISKILGPIKSVGDAAIQGAKVGAIMGAGSSEADNKYDLLKDTVVGGGFGALTGGAVQGTAQAVGKGLNYVGKESRTLAERFAKNATGATGLQSAKFKDNIGRELLDSGVVQFGDDASKVAQRAGEKITQAEQGIDKALSKADKSGVKVSVENILNKIDEKILSLSKDPSKSDVVRNLQKIQEDIVNSGESFILPSQAEKIKRGFNKQAKNWMDEQKGEAGKAAYRIYKDSVEEAAAAAGDDVASALVNSKKQFGTFVPVEEAATKRAAQLEQSQFGNLLDMTTGVGGGILSGSPVMGVLSGAAMAGLRRVVAPRISSSAAVTLDKVGQALLSSPETAMVAKKLLQENPAAYQNVINQITNSFKPQKPILGEEPERGPERWAYDGAKNIISKDKSLEPIVSKAFESKEGKILLQEAQKASDEKLQKVIEKLKSKYSVQPEIKEAAKPQENISKFPVTLRKKGLVAQVSNQDEMDEAMSEGWKI